jgi:tropomyosin, fungi type
MAEVVREKLKNLRLECDNSTVRAEIAEQKARNLQEKYDIAETEVTVLRNRIYLLEEELLKNERLLSDSRKNRGDDETLRGRTEELLRKLTLLEDTLEQTETRLNTQVALHRDLELKCEELERQLRQVKAERDDVTHKYQDLAKKHATLSKDYEEIVKSLQDL